MLPKNPTYTFIQTYTFISFQQKFPPICLFPPILLLVFEEISHLYFYSDSSSIRNSRVPETPEVPEVTEVQQEAVQQEVIQARTVPDKPSFADIVTRRGRISRPTRCYL